MRKTILIKNSITNYFIISKYNKFNLKFNLLYVNIVFVK